MILGVLTIFFGIVWIHWPLLGYAPSVFINVYPVAPQPDQRCYGVLVPFPYPWSCPPNYERLPSPFDVLPILAVIYFGIGSATIGTVLIQKLVYIVIPAFLADWTLFSIAVGLIWILPGLSRLLKRR